MLIPIAILRTRRANADRGILKIGSKLTCTLPPLRARGAQAAGLPHRVNPLNAKLHPFARVPSRANNWECLSERDRVSDPRFNMRMASGHRQS
jgi:hypothetical protein